jgi:predicted NBD/HSP70 family sugar kinase
MKVLVIDIGGNNIKLLATGQEQVRKTPSGAELTPEDMVKQVLQTTHDWSYEAVTMGYPGPVVHGQPLLEPWNLGTGWVGFDYASHFRRPVKIINDAAMQALGSYEGGRMLFMGLGTGLGTALVIENLVVPLELAHLPYRKKQTYEDYLGTRGLDRLGPKKWQRAVEDVTERFRHALVVDYVVLGGGNAKKLEHLPPNARLGNNNHAFRGGFRLWEIDEATHKQRYGNA